MSLKLPGLHSEFRISRNYMGRLSLKNKERKKGGKNGRQAGRHVLDSSTHWPNSRGVIRVTGLTYPASKRLLLYRGIDPKPRGSFGSYP